MKGSGDEFRTRQLVRMWDEFMDEYPFIQPSSFIRTLMLKAFQRGFVCGEHYEQERVINAS